MKKPTPADLRRARRECVRAALRALDEPVSSGVLAARLNLPRPVVVATLEALEIAAPPTDAPFPSGPLCVETGWVWVE